MSTAAHTNALARERSPYLLQHARNPVDWLPWGDEAFEKARREDKPVFLSVGYSACHWCHVMERESFEDEATARVLNEHFVSVKVDREERPDVDQTYQLAHQVLTQRAGGWPLSMFLTPDRRPFFGGTYFPNAARYGMPSFVEVLEAVLDAWRSRRDDVTEQAAELTDALARVTAASPGRGGAPDDVLLAAVKRALPRVDRERGGFGRAPKFPNTMTVDLLVAAAALNLPGVAADCREAAAVTMVNIARGGIRDHLGGGFARYSTDERWQVPHFEKMLYDNALLARLFLDGSRLLAGEGAWCQGVVRTTFEYVLREMTSPEGVFYSAQDADSEGEEGRFFAWTPREVADAVGPDDAPAVCAWFDVTDEGNWERGRSVLWTPRPLAEVARAAGRTPEEVAAAVERARPKLFEARERRPKPARDDKCLAGWNALMIGALADAGATLGVDAWLDASVRALDEWHARGWREVALAHAIKGAEAYGTGFLDDHAGMASAAIDVYEATGAAEALAFARALLGSVLARFVDEATGEFYFSPADAEVVLHRSRDPFDHAYPGGAGLALDALLRAAALTGHAPFRDAALRAADAYAAAAAENPLGLATVARAVDRARRGAVEVIVVGDPARDDTRAMRRAARCVALPHRTLVGVRDADEAARHGLDPHLLEGRAAGPDGAPVAYVCRGTACEMPARSAEALTETLRRVAATALTSPRD